LGDDCVFLCGGRLCQGLTTKPVVGYRDWNYSRACIRNLFDS